MKMVLKIILGMSLLLTLNAQAMDIQGSHSGGWYNPDQSGHGFSIEILDDEKLVAYWMVFTPDGKPTFLVTLADIDGDTAYGTLHQYSGMRFGEFDPATLEQEVWGELSMTFTGCDTATVTYQSAATHSGIPLGSGQIDLIRLTSIDGLKCTQQLPEDQFGNFLTGLKSYSYWPDDSFVWILPDGTLAYQAASDYKVFELGYGHLVMIDENAFEFEVTTSDGSRHGTGMFEDGRVTLNLDGVGVLSGPLDPAFHDEITYGDLAGEYSGPDLIFHATVDETGEFTGLSIGGDIWGTLTIPEPGLNQIVQEFHFGGTDSTPGGVNQGVGVYDRASGNLLFISARGSEVFDNFWIGSK